MDHGGSNQGSPMGCDAVEELAGAYALGAVPADEAAQVREHLAGCSAHLNLFLDMQAAADVLSLACDEVEPPVALKERVLAAAASSADAGAADRPASREPTGEGHAPPGEPAQGGRLLRFTQSGGRRPSLFLGLGLAAALLLAVGLAAWNVSLHRSLDQRGANLDQQRVVLTALANGGHASPLGGNNGFAGVIVVTADGGTAYLVATLPPPPAGKAYEAWMIRGSSPVPAGLLTSGGTLVTRLQGSAAGVQVVAFTLERKSGSVTPTQPILASATLSSSG